MQRIKIPYGGLNANQLEVLADLAEEYSDGIAHITTRQDVQLHFVHIEDTPTVMRRLASVGITTREACGNSVRNVTACPYAGVCPDEAFDVTPYARALVAISAWTSRLPGLWAEVQARFQRLPSARVRLGRVCMTSGSSQRLGSSMDKKNEGLRLVVGGGLGSVPYQAKLFDEFLAPEELLPITQAIARVFGRLGEKKNRNRARIKFLVHELGIEKFKDLVMEERKILPHDSRWTEYVADAIKEAEQPLAPASPMPDRRFRTVSTMVEDQHSSAKAGRIRCRDGDPSLGRCHPHAAPGLG